MRRTIRSYVDRVAGVTPSAASIFAFTDAARRGEPADAPTRGEHAVARDHDRERVAAERLADRARRAGRTHGDRDVAVRQRLACGDGAHDLEHLASERRERVEVERDVDEVVGLTAQRRHHAVDRVADRGRRRSLHGFAGRALELVLQAPPGVDRPRLGEHRALDDVAVPRDPTLPDRRVEQRVLDRCWRPAHAGSPCGWRWSSAMALSPTRSSLPVGFTGISSRNTTSSGAL